MSILHPRETSVLLGHEAAERKLLDAYRAGRLHHAHLIEGPRGVGKATLAYRLARFVLAYPDRNAVAVREARDLFLSPDDPTFARTASGGHPDVLALETGMDGKQGISVDVLRRGTTFLEQTAALGGYRVLVIDPGEEMAAPAANALLKMLEEPGHRTLILVVSHRPGRLLPTIRSRTLRTRLGEMDAAALRKGAEVLGHADLLEGPQADARQRLARGSLGRFLSLSEKDFAIDEQFRALTGQLPRLPVSRAHAFADGLNKRDSFDAFLPDLLAWLAGRAREQEGGKRLDAWARLWEKTAHAARLADAYNLERRQVVLDALSSAAKIAADPAPTNRP